MTLLYGLLTSVVRKITKHAHNDVTVRLAHDNLIKNIKLPVFFELVCYQIRGYGHGIMEIPKSDSRKR